MKKGIMQTGKIWAYLSAFMFFAMCGLVVYAVNSSNTFDKYKVENLYEEILYAEDWDDLMDDLNNRFVPEGTIVAFEGECPENGWVEYPYANGNGSITYCVKIDDVQSSSRNCPALGGCEETANGGECITYENNAPVGSACEATTSTCVYGRWSIEPKQYSGCTARCAELGVCAETSAGGTCNSYTTNKSVGSACPKTVSTCQANGQWDREPEQYGSCSVYCEETRRYTSECYERPSQYCRVCPESRQGSTCVTYRTLESTDCNKEKIVSTCQSNGKWSPYTDLWDTCETIPPYNPSSSYSSSSYYGGQSEVTCGYYKDKDGGYEWVPDQSAQHRNGDRSDEKCRIYPQEVVWKCRANVYCEHYNVTCTKDGDRCRASNSSFSSHCCCTVGKDYNCIK